MVESTSTTPSETGSTWAAGTSDFSSRLDATTHAAVSVLTAEQGGIQSLVSFDAYRTRDIEARGRAVAEAIVKQLPRVMSVNQAERLVWVYGYGDELSASSIIKSMTDDGFLISDSSALSGWSCRTSSIDGRLIANALRRAVGVDSGTALTAAQFDTATDKLFGDSKGISAQIANFLAQAVSGGDSLSADQLATIFDRHYVQISINPSYDFISINFAGPGNVTLRSDSATVAAYMMLYDGNVDAKNADGVLNAKELVQAIFPKPSQRSDVTNSRANAMWTLLACYGERGIDGSMVIGRQGLVAMLNDRSLYLPGNYGKFGDDFGVNLQAITIEHVISGAFHHDGRGPNKDGEIDQGSLVALFKKLGQDLTSEQATFLVKVYRDANTGRAFLTPENVQRMRKDGFFNTGAVLGDKCTLNWNSIDGGLISDALCRAVGLASGTALTAVQFDTATDNLFGDNRGVTGENAVLLTRIFGTNGTLNREQVAQIFDSNSISMAGLSGQKFVWIHTDVTAENLTFLDRSVTANFIMLSDANNDGWLNAGELRAAITSRLATGEVMTDAVMQTYMDCYGDKNPDGTMAVSRYGVMAMLNEGALNVPVYGTASSTSFDIKLNAIPIARVIWGASFGDKESLYDGTLSKGELVTLFSDLKVGISPEQAQFLITVYGNGTTVNVDNVKQMRDDGFLTTGAVLGEKCTLNWKNIDGLLLARAIFKKNRLDPDAAKATLTADQFGQGYKSLYSDTPIQALNDPAGLVKAFGTKNTLTVVQMASALNGLNVDSSIEKVSLPRTGQFIIDALPLKVPAFHITSWWSSVLKFAGDEAKDVVSTISQIAGVTEDVVAGVLNGKLSVEAGLAQGGYKIVTAILDAVKTGDERAKKLIDTLGKAINAAISDLSAEGKTLIKQMVEAAKAGVSEAEIRALSMLSGMPPDDAKARIESMASKGTIVKFAKDMSYENMKAMIPNYDDTLAALTKLHEAAVAAFGNSDADRKMLAADGYTFDSNDNLVKGGRVLSNIEKLDAFGQFARADIAVELTAVTVRAGVDIAGALNVLQFRAFYAYAGKDANGNAQHQLRLRITEEAGVDLPPLPVVASGGDIGLFTIHDLVISWSVSPTGVSTKNDVRWNSALGMVAEGYSPKLGNNIPPPLGDVIPPPLEAIIGEDGLAPVALPPEWKGNAEIEVGTGFGATVSYNLTKLGDFWWTPFLSELVGAAIGGVASTAALSGVEAETAGVATPFVVSFGPEIIHASTMLGGFAADLVYAGAETVEKKDQATVSFGVFAWMALKAGAKVAPLPGASVGITLRGQVSVGVDLNNLY
jgi:hypothetical protein